MADDSPRDPEAFVDNLPLTAAFGTHPKTRILGAMLTEDPPTDFSVNELSRITGLDEEAVVKHTRDLLDVGIVVETDDLADATYGVDQERDVVAALRRLNEALAELVFRDGG